MNFKIDLQSSCKTMNDRKKRGEDRSTEVPICREQKNLFRWDKKHFS